MLDITRIIINIMLKYLGFNDLHVIRWFVLIIAIPQKVLYLYSAYSNFD